MLSRWTWRGPCRPYRWAGSELWSWSSCTGTLITTSGRGRSDLLSPACPCGPGGPAGPCTVLHPAISSTSKNAPTASHVFILILHCGVARRKTLPPRTIARSEDTTHSAQWKLFQFAQLSNSLEGGKKPEWLTGDSDSRLSRSPSPDGSDGRASSLRTLDHAPGCELCNSVQTCQSMVDMV